ncbi:MAG: aminodeoxychorismate/anthranilate synthase component II [Gemmatimonadota bacterium]
MILLIDNYDSFVFNLARYFNELGETVRVARNDGITLDEIRALDPTHVVLSPGPCTPSEAGVSCTIIEELSETVPLLGVCLGHQCIAAAFGGRVERAARPMHGIVSDIEHDGEGLFSGLPSPLAVTRYHSLIVPETACGEGVVVTARSRSGEVMALAHSTRPLWGVQFHPEAVMTWGGHRLLANFLALGRGQDSVDVTVEVGRCGEIRATRQGGSAVPGSAVLSRRHAREAAR